MTLSLLAPTGALIVMMCYYTIIGNILNFHSAHWFNWCHKTHSLMTLMTMVILITLGPLWDHSGTTLRPLWDHYGITLGSLWDHSWITLGSLSDHSWITPWSLSDYTWMTLGSLWNTLGSLWNTLGHSLLLVSFCQSVPPEFFQYIFLPFFFSILKTIICLHSDVQHKDPLISLPGKQRSSSCLFDQNPN